MISIGELKRGDSMRYLAQLRDEGGNPSPYTATDIKCEIRTISESLVCLATISDGDSVGDVYIECTDTTKWPIGTLVMDIQVSDGDIIASTETVSLKVVKDVTSNG